MGEKGVWARSSRTTTTTTKNKKRKRFQKKAGAGEEVEYFLLTAAHILVHLNPNVTTLGIQWPSVTVNANVEMKLTELYVTQEYVRSGTLDVGLAKVEFVGKDIARMMKRKLVTIEHCDVGRTAVGRGRVHVGGRCVHEESMRVMIHAPSPPGCNGTPLFTNTMGLSLIVHGESKHRRHSYIGVEGASHFVYADCLDKCSFYLVPNSKQVSNLLRLAEDVDPNSAGSSDKLKCMLLIMQGLKTACTRDELEAIDSSNEQVLLDLLASAIWSGDTAPLLLGETIDCLRRENEVEASERIAEEAAARTTQEAAAAEPTEEAEIFISTVTPKKRD
jgi:hypothetical protein